MHQILPVFFSTVCLVEAVSWSMSDNMQFSGYIATNGNIVISTSGGGYRGFYLVEFDVSSCSSKNLLHFDTWASTTDSDNMATYINGLPSNTVLIGVTADEPQNALTQNAKSALLAIGVNVAGLQYRGKVTFVAQIGRPTMTVSQVMPGGDENVKLIVNITGTQLYRVVTSLRRARSLGKEQYLILQLTL
jgi:Interleukin-like EMT inducer